ncbi:MAG: hypothetical protein QXX55_00335 [Candidatus Pacearchaeota archaeon]
MSLDDNSRLSALLILEVLGRPPEYLTETLKNLIEGIRKEKGIFLKSDKISDAKEIKEDKNFYTSFAEIEIEVENVAYLTSLIFKYMPAYIEIISPKNITMSNNNFNDFFNELIRRLHEYDEIARIIQIDRQKLIDKIKELEKNSIDKKDEKKE